MISVDPGDTEQGGACWAEWAGDRLVACGEWPFWRKRLRDENVVCETQVIIPRFTKKPASIIKLAQRTGVVLAQLDLSGPDDTRVKMVRPSSWKGASPKPRAAPLWATYAIHRLVMKALDPREVEIYWAQLSRMPEGKRHNLADGVGIGLDDLGRLK